MAVKFTDRIREYCNAAGIDIPAGFYRHPASRYVVINLETTPPKLVAKTWFKQEDLLYYLQHLAAGQRVQILDFKVRETLQLEPSQTLKRGQPF